MKEVDSEDGFGTARARLEWGGGGQFSKRNPFKNEWEQKNPKSEKKSKIKKKREIPLKKNPKNVMKKKSIIVGVF